MVTSIDWRLSWILASLRPGARCVKRDNYRGGLDHTTLAKTRALSSPIPPVLLFDFKSGGTQGTVTLLLRLYEWPLISVQCAWRTSGGSLRRCHRVSPIRSSSVFCDY